MKRIFLKNTAIATTASFLLLGLASAADLQVGPGEAYFAGWTFNVSDNPRGCGNPDIIASTSSITGTLGALTYEIHGLGTTRTMLTTETSWVDCRWTTFGGNVPAGNNPPTRIDTSHSRAGTYLHTFNAPLPSGSLLLMQDFDGQEQTDITFRNCSGQAIDASAFDWLRVSAPSASVVIPSHTAGATWRITGTSGSSSNETTAIAIRSSEVCQIETLNTKPSLGGGRHFFFATPPVADLAVNISTTGGPSAGFSGNYEVTLSCTKDGIDVTPQLLPASPVTVAGGTAAPSILNFQQIPVGAICTASQVQPASPSGYSWNGAPPPQTVTTIAGTGANNVTWQNELLAAVVPPQPSAVAPAPVPTLSQWGLLFMAFVLGLFALVGARKRHGG